MFTFLPKPIHHFITDHNLGGPLAIALAARFGYGASFHTGDMLFGRQIMDTSSLARLLRRLSEEGTPNPLAKCADL